MEEQLPTQAPLARPSLVARLTRVLRPSHAHSAFSATLVLMVSVFLSRIIGLVRVKYIMWLFGSGMQADALNAAFVLPDMISYFLVGGAASITFVTILTRYRETGREKEGERSLSIILSTMYLVLGSAILLAEIVAPWYVGWWFPGFDAEKAALCVRLTRILLPAQLFFFAGGVFGAVLLVRKQFNVQAVSPLIYNLGTIVGGLLLVKQLGVASLAIGTVAGAFFGPFFLNWISARRAGVRYRPILDWHDEGLREWVRLSLPLIAGVSLVTADNWIIAHFASRIGGAVSQFNYAKQFFTAPMAVLAQAAGAASMPFFASLWAKDNRYEFANVVAESVSRVACLGLLAASAMIALGKPAIDLVFTGGHFTRTDAAQCFAYFAVFSVSMFLWSAQAIYSRAFYAAGNTLVPMAAGTVVTIVSLPIYFGLFHAQGAMGLAVASDIGIAMQTLAIAVLLHRRQMVSLAGLDYPEMGRCLASCIAGGLITWFLISSIARLVHTHGRWYDLIVLLLGGALWAGISLLVLKQTGSALPRVLMKRLRLA
ncbi:murein biosynthesis integral membrane protein MurJ [Occallatibacter savannae]|uniref:murein biosynthesis integral membrane protein MurJ n=1 Tax=Occallatibacter savannae TaxID=1002691 RepID=UPI000D6999A2|nr:murein biosynthesis integral membrane protein MurJ [Occallatibacter savannae]